MCNILNKFKIGIDLPNYEWKFKDKWKGAL